MLLINSYFFENKKEPQRNCEQFPGSSASRSLICVRKRRKAIMTKHPLSEGDDDDDGGGDGRISWPPPAPFPITPRDSISRSGISLTPTMSPAWADRSEGYF